MIVGFVMSVVLHSVLIEGGTFTPLYGLDKDQQSMTVSSFRMDPYPVTNQEFFKFTKSHFKWQPGQPSSLLADKDYLSHWKGKRPSRKLENVPVTYVSWFAAHDYCAAQKGRLPTVLEWEYVASASETKKDASQDKEFIEKLLQWYSKPTEDGKISRIGQGKPNIWGVYDLHGVVWEWTHDFNSVFVTGDNRQDKDKLKNLFCGFGGQGAQNRSNYAAFMRYALRNSLKGNYTLMNLGFRCAYDL